VEQALKENSRLRDSRQQIFDQLRYLTGNIHGTQHSLNESKTQKHLSQGLTEITELEEEEQLLTSQLAV